MDGHIYETFAEAARSLGLLQNTSEAQICMDDAVADLCSPAVLRYLFVALVAEGAPAKHLYDIHLDFLIQHYTVNKQMSKPMAVNALLLDLQCDFDACGKTMDTLGLPRPIEYITEVQK